MFARAVTRVVPAGLVLTAVACRVSPGTPENAAAAMAIAGSTADPSVSARPLSEPTAASAGPDAKAIPGSIRWSVDRVQRNRRNSCVEFDLDGSIDFVDAAGRWQPFDANVGFRIFVARTQEVRPVWTDGATLDVAIGAIASGSSPGRWRAIGLGGADRVAATPGGSGKYWAVLAFDGAGTEIRADTWQQIELPGPPVATPLQRELMVPTGLSGWTGTYDPIAVVRAVNALWPLGRERALAELRAFAREASIMGGRQTDRARLDTADSQIVYFLVRLLFEPDPTRPSCPPIDGKYSPVRYWRDYPLCTGGMVCTPDAPDAYPDARYPLVVVDDIPFVVADRVVMRTGWDQDPLEHVEWAERAGRLRERPLRPGDDLISAAQRAAASYPGNGAADNFGIIRWRSDFIYDQLATSIASTLGIVRSSQDQASWNPYGSPASLPHELETAWREGRFHWDPEQQMFVRDAR